MRYFIRRESRFKDGAWSEGGYLAYLEDYNTRPLNGRGANYWIRRGFTEQEAIDALTKTYERDQKGQNLSDGYWMIKNGLVPEYDKV